jgi:uncharacterized protein YcfL
MTINKALLSMAIALACCAAQAQTATNPTTPSEPGSAASKLMLRGEPLGVKVVDMRAQKRNDVLVVQTELLNTENGDRQVYWRYRWLDATGMQVGDGDAWKPLLMYGQQSQFLKGTAPSSKVVDFRLEMNTEKR